MQHRFTVALKLVAVASVALVAACSSDAFDPNETAHVRMVNASASNTISATNEGRTVASGLTFQNGNGPASCATVEHGGDEDVTFNNSSTGAGLGVIKYNFVAKNNYTVVFYAPNTISIYPETFTSPPAANNAIRFINATSTAGDIYLTQPADPIVGTPTIANLGSNQVSGFNSSTAPGGTFVNYPVSNIRVRLFNVGQQIGTPRADFTISGLPASRVGTVILTPSNNGVTGFLVTACAG